MSQSGYIPLEDALVKIITKDATLIKTIVDGKVGDSVNYLILLEGLFEEARVAKED